MSIFSIGPHKWRYDFKYKGQRYQSKNFKNKGAATAAQEIKRHNLKLGIDIKASVPIEESDVFMEKDLVSFKKKYQFISKDPQYTLPILFDMLMNEMSLPYNFRDILKLAKDYKKNKTTIPAKLRLKILKRDNYTCQMCGAKAPEVQIHVDHAIPLSRGGLTEEKNLRTLCKDCNLGKSDLPLEVLI
jgi:hypothetical protein